MIIGRTQTNGPADYDAVHKVQDGYSIAPLGNPVEHVVDAGCNISTEPPKTVTSMSAVDFFSHAGNCGPPSRRNSASTSLRS